jgi:hypothetical protein
MAAKPDRGAVNPTEVEQLAPGRFRLKKAVSDTTAKGDADKLHTLISEWEASDSLNANEFRELTKRTMIAVLRAVIWVATRRAPGDN